MRILDPRCPEEILEHSVADNGLTVLRHVGNGAPPSNATEGSTTCRERLGRLRRAAKLWGSRAGGMLWLGI